MSSFALTVCSAYFATVALTITEIVSYFKIALNKTKKSSNKLETMRLSSILPPKSANLELMMIQSK